MAIDRTAILRNAEKLVRQGKLNDAIAEYLRIVDEQPGDWNSANILGDLYLRAGVNDKAVEQFTRIADSLCDQGFLPKASALYKKILKIKPDDEHALLRSAELAAGQGLLGDARAALQAVAAQRDARGDERGVIAIHIRLGSLDPDDVAARVSAAHLRVQLDDPRGAAEDLTAIAAYLDGKGRHVEALEMLREAVAVAPDNEPARTRLAAACMAAGDLESAAEYATLESVGDDEQLMLRIAERRFRGGHVDEGIDVISSLLARNINRRQDVALLGWTLAESAPEIGYRLVELSADAAVRESDWPSAAAGLQEFVTRVPNHVPALMRLVEVCVDGGLEATMYSAQAQLADAYIAAGVAAPARALAEDLVAREPWDRANLERFRRCLALMGESDPDAVIAERLSGQSPFIATDVRPVDRSAEAAFAAAPDAGSDVPSNLRRDVLPGPAFPTSEIDLSVVLAGLGGDAEDGHAAAPSSPDAAERDLTRGIALYSAGAIDDAIAALEIACRAPQVCFRGASLAGRLLRERGDLERAIDFFERAAGAAAPNLDDARDLLYELAEALETSGESARALAIYLEIQADAGDFRDVALRVDRLRTQAGR